MVTVVTRQIDRQLGRLKSEVSGHSETMGRCRGIGRGPLFPIRASVILLQTVGTLDLAGQSIQDNLLALVKV